MIHFCIQREREGERSIQWSFTLFNQNLMIIVAKFVLLLHDDAHIRPTAQNQNSFPIKRLSFGWRQQQQQHHFLILMFMSTYTYVCFCFNHHLHNNVNNLICIYEYIAFILGKYSSFRWNAIRNHLGRQVEKALQLFFNIIDIIYFNKVV